MFPFLNLLPELQIRTLYYTDTPTLLTLAASSRKLRRQSRAEFAFRRNDLIHPFVDKTTFLPEMEECHALITGQHSFAFFHPEDIPWVRFSTPLTFVVPSEHRLRFLRHLCHVQHYYPVGRQRRFQYAGQGHEVVLRRDTQVVKVISSPNGCPFWPIIFFYTSAWMNAIGATHFYCAYPRFTLTQRSFLNPKHMLNGNIPSAHLIRALAYDRLVGIETRTTPLAWEEADVECPHKDTCPLQERHFVDDFALAMPLTPYDTFERPRKEGSCRTEWKLGGWEEFPLDTQLIRFETFVNRNV